MLPLIELILLMRPVPVPAVVEPCHRHGMTLGVDASRDESDGGGERSGRTYATCCLCCSSCSCCCCCCW
uniref:Putative secreted protein n=1 Tax=Anopheles darlingi TaxID=43151 RepID=A0A2M4D4H4_ANODA